jgi:hypothetical protein
MTNSVTNNPPVRTTPLGPTDSAAPTDGTGNKPVVRDVLPPQQDVVRGPRPRYGLPEPQLTKSQALQELDAISKSLTEFDFSQPATESGVAEVTRLRDQLMALMLKLRSSSMLNRDEELRNMVKDRLAGIQKGLDSAYKELVSGMVAGAFQVAGGAMQMTGGFKGLGGGKGATGLDAGKGAFDSQAMMQKWSGAGQTVQGMGSFITSPLNYEAKKDEAAKSKLDLSADVADRKMGQDQERMAKALEDFRAFLSAEQQAMEAQTQAANRIFS